MRGEVLDAAGNRIGKVRGGAYFSLSGSFRGRFIATREGVFLADSGKILGTLEGDTLYSPEDGTFLAAIKRSIFPARLVLLFLIALFFLSLTLALGYRFIPHTTGRLIDRAYTLSGDQSSYSLDIDIPAAFKDGEGELMAPGMRGEFLFTIKNGSSAALTCEFLLGEDNEAGIDMRYRLLQDGELISEEEYVPIEELLLTPNPLEAGETVLFELQWYWAHNDPVDTWVGENDAYYGIRMAFRAVPAE